MPEFCYTRLIVTQMQSLERSRMKKSDRKWLKKGFIGIAGAYLLACSGLYIFQRHLIFRPVAQVYARPSDRAFNMPAEDVQIPVGKGDRLHGWWISAPTPTENITVLPQEPVRVLKSPKTLLYFTGIGGNKSSSNYLHRMRAFRQLGFAVLIVDYRGYGQSSGEFPSEAQVYEDAEATWNYLTTTRRILANQIVLYGESFGGAIALDLASKHADLSGVIVQGTFTSMNEMAAYRGWSRLFPVDWLLTQRFDSISKVRSLQVPILLIHGTTDDVVPVDMARQLYAAAPEPKMLHLVENANHFNVYQPGDRSYLKAIQQFMTIKRYAAGGAGK
jgi:uncharacterized protein